MLRLQFLITLAITMALLFTPYVHAETGGNIAINAAQVIDDRSVDILGELNYTADLFTLEVDTQLQQGNIYRGKTHAELTLLNNYKVVVDTTSKGGTWDTLGHDHNAYIAFSIPVKSLNFDIGIGGKKASPWGQPSAFNKLVSEGYDEGTLETIPKLKEIYPAPSGLPFQDGAFLQGYIATGFKKGNVDIDIKTALQLTGEDKAHQLLTRLDYQYGLGDTGLTLNFAGEVQFMTYQKTIHYETAGFAGIGYRWGG